jgi:hypothetical protein
VDYQKGKREWCHFKNNGICEMGRLRNQEAKGRMVLFTACRMTAVTLNVANKSTYPCSVSGFREIGSV